jgi:hypothetical protein
VHRSEHEMAMNMRGYQCDVQSAWRFMSMIRGRYFAARAHNGKVGTVVLVTAPPGGGFPCV